MKNKSGFSKISLEIYNCIKNEYSGRCLGKSIFIG